jgi:GAF domain-containing protein
MGQKGQADPALRGQLRTLWPLYELSARLSRSKGLSEVCEAAVEAIVQLASAQRASVLLFDEQGIMGSGLGGVCRRPTGLLSTGIRLGAQTHLIRTQSWSRTFSSILASSHCAP